MDAAAEDGGGTDAGILALVDELIDLATSRHITDNPQWLVGKDAMAPYQYVMDDPDRLGPPRRPPGLRGLHQRHSGRRGNQHASSRAEYGVLRRFRRSRAAFELLRLD